jgi:cytoskeleton protein RodZ
VSIAHFKKSVVIAIVALLVGIFLLMMKPSHRPAEIERDPVNLLRKTSVPVIDARPIIGCTRSGMLDVATTATTLSTTGTVSEVDADATADVLALCANGGASVEVTDAKGLLQLRKPLRNGDLVYVFGALPLSVVLGRADVVDVGFRGQWFDALPLAEDNVARFEVK